MKQNIIEVQNLKKYFTIEKGIIKKNIKYIKAVDNVSFVIKEKETLGLVGESGCGKSTLARVILKLSEPTENTVLFQGKDITKLKGEDLKNYKKNVNIVFQDPSSSLNPRKTVRQILKRSLEVHKYRKESMGNIIIKILQKGRISYEINEMETGIYFSFYILDIFHRVYYLNTSLPL